jgi:oligoribonuclease
VTDRATQRLVWVDCEMTGLDLTHDALIEVAAIVTDAELVPLDDGVDVIIHVDDDVLQSMLPVVRDMHASSGLTEAVRASTITLGDAERQIVDYVRGHVPEAKTAPLCGNSIATDRGFLARDMPALDGYLHYRMIDVSSIKELAIRWYPKVYFAQPQKGLAHRALADVRESIQELIFYRRTLFVAEPGPTSEEAQVAARTILGATTDPVD